MTITPDANAAVGIYDIAIRGWSQTNPAVVTASPLKVEVVLRSTRFDLAGLVALAPAGSTASFTATLVPEDDASTGVAGATVTFTLTQDDVVAFTATTTTDANGVATVTAPPSVLPGTYELSIETQRLGQFAPATSAVAFVIRSPAQLIQDVADQLTAMLPGAQSRGASVSAQLQLVGLTGESIARTQLARAQAASPGSTKELAKIADLIATGRTQLQAAKYDEALTSFKQAVSKAAGLLR